MKTKIAVLLVATLAAAGIGAAQTINLVIVNRQAHYVQTEAGAASLSGATPYEFVINMNGTGLETPFAISFKKPGDAVTSYPGFEQTAGVELQAPVYPVGHFASMAALHSAFPDGVYTIQATGFSNASLTMPNLIGTTNDGFANTPFVTGTQDGVPVNWIGAKMSIDPGKELTLTSNTFVTNYTEGAGRIGLWSDGSNDEVTNESPPNSFVFSGNSVQLQIAANTFSPGTYAAGLEFNNIVSPLIDLSSIYGPNAYGVSIYTASTKFQIEAIPEPSTYATVFGALALLGVLMQRRRWSA